MENKTTSLIFNSKIALENFIELIDSNEFIRKKKSNFQTIEDKKGEQSRCIRKTPLQIMGLALKEEGLIFNAKLIYEFYRASKSTKLEQVECDLEKCKRLLDLFEEIEINYSNLSVDLKKRDGTIMNLAEIKMDVKKIVGRPFDSGKSQFKAKTKSEITNNYLVKKNYKNLDAWKIVVGGIQRSLCGSTYSMYYYVEYKVTSDDNFKKFIGRKREVRRGLITFEEYPHCKIYLRGTNNLLNSEEEYATKYTVSPIGPKKFKLKTDEILLNDGSQVGFFMELEGIQFNDFVLGYYTERNLRYGFRLGTSILVKESEGSDKEEILERKFISYTSLDDIPIKELRDFFRERSRNFLKPPTIDGNNEFENLKNKIYDQKDKPKDLAFFEYDGYVASPITADTKKSDSKNYEERKNVCDEIIKLFWGEKLFYFAQNKTIDEYKDRIKSGAFYDNIETIAKSKYFVLIIPELDSTEYRTSKAFLELGAAIFAKRPILMICDNKSQNYIPKKIGNKHKIICFDFNLLKTLTESEEESAIEIETINKNREEIEDIQRKIEEWIVKTKKITAFF